jgi:hypothetical protein
LFGLGVLFVGFVIVGLGIGVGVIDPPPEELVEPRVTETEFDEEPDPELLTAFIKTE